MARIPDAEIAEAAREAGFTSTEITKMVAIALAESSGDPRAIGDGGKSFGLWQIHKPSHPELFKGDWTSPKINAQMARGVYGKQGFNAWSVYKSGAYLLFMPRATAAVSRDSQGTLQKNLPESVGGALDTAQSVTATVNRVGDWIGTPSNWLRVAYVVVGMALIVGGLVTLARPIVEPAVKTAIRVGSKGTL